MAKISLEFDTVTKALVVKKDGAMIENVYGISAFKAWSYDDDEDGEKFSVSITTKDENKEDKMTTYTNMTASQVTRETRTSLEDAILKHFEGVL